MLPICPLPPPAHIVWLGGSIGQGDLIPRRYSTQVSQALRTREINLAVNGTTLERIHEPSGLTQLSRITAKPRNQKAFVVIAHTYNTFGVDRSSPAIHYNALRETVAIARSKGYSAQEVVIVSPFAIDPRAPLPRMRNGSQPDIFRFVTRVVAAIEGTRYADGWSATVGRAYPDLIHPDQIGHDAIAKVIYPALCSL
jgi:GDSL-like Lipase/Acylhydrolase family